jgi:hypothetical protein
MTELAGEIRSNLKRSELNYDEELPTPVVVDPLPYDDTHNQQLIEEEQQWFERNYAAAAAQRWTGQERWMGKENEEMRLVNILHPHAVFEKLRAAGINASIDPAVDWVWDSDHKTGLIVKRQKTLSNARLWLHDAVLLGRVAISAWVWQDGERRPQYITHLQYPYGPEWSVMRFNEYDVPTCEKYRGWRTAMLKLIIDGILTEEEVDRAFGPVTTGEVSALYREQLAAHREEIHKRGHT